jgi:SSS family solute:Na+ symporter
MLSHLFSEMNVFHFVFLYLIFSVVIGVIAGMRIKTAADFVVAGRNLNLTFVMAMVFATWFGSEAILGMPAEFIIDGFAGIIKDPFGAFFCLSIVGLFFARRWYRLNVFTLADIYNKRFGSKVEILMTVAIVISYFGWVAAQITALGVVINVLSAGAIHKEVGIILGASVVLLYTLSGGMLSIAINDLVQMFIIIISLVFLGFYFSDLAGGFTNVIEQANKDNMFVFMKGYDKDSFIKFFGALFTLMLGSIPQQDIFQRVTSAKNERTAQFGMLSGAFLYLAFCLIPIFLVVSTKIIDPTIVDKWIEEDSEMILPMLIMSHTPFIAKVLFFGALLSAIMSTASGTLLAPSVTINQNIIKKIFPKMDDKRYIMSLRITILITGILITLFALRSTSSIYEMVGDAYKITLVTAVSPLFAAMFWKRATTFGALSSIIIGFAVWIIGEALHINQPQLFGFIASLFAMILGSLMTKRQSDEIINSVMAPKVLKK